MIPQHSSNTDSHFTPPDYVEAARRALGGVTLDPASCAEANETIRAVKWFGKKDDGLRMDWGSTPGTSRVFLNPPGGKLRRCGDLWVPVPENKGPGASSMAVWWGKLVQEFRAERVEAFVFIGFTLEILRLSQDCEICPAPCQYFSMCFPEERIRFGGAKSPTHANVIVGGGSREYEERFMREFRLFGVCVPGLRKH